MVEFSICMDSSAEIKNYSEKQWKKKDPSTQKFGQKPETRDDQDSVNSGVSRNLVECLRFSIRHGLNKIYLYIKG